MTCEHLTLVGTHRGHHCHECKMMAIEVEELCPHCGGAGLITPPDTLRTKNCKPCDATGIVINYVFPTDVIPRTQSK